MHDHLTPLRSDGWVAYNVHNGHVLAIMASHTTIRRELPRSECRDVGSCAIDTGVTISCIGGYELVRIAFPVKVIICNKVEESKLIVYKVCKLCSMVENLVEELPPGTPKTERIPSSCNLLKR